MPTVSESAYVTAKGQVVVPALLRRKFGIKAGTRINFSEVDGNIVIQPVTREFIDSFCGLFKTKAGAESAVQALLNDRTKERAQEDRKVAGDRSAS